MRSGLEGSYTTVGRTKRQQEVLERLDAGMPVQKIATDLGVTRYAELVEAAIAEGDVAALAYELGRLDAGGRGEVPAKLIEAALRRRAIIGGGEPKATEPGET